MSAVSILIFILGVAKLCTGAMFGHVAQRTWNLPHPIGRSVTPVLFTSLAGVFVLDGLRAFSFILKIEDAFVLGIWCTLMVNVFVLWATYNVQRRMLNVED